MMALILSDGFDIYADRDDVGKSGWFYRNASSTFSTSNGRFGGGCLQGSNHSFNWKCPSIVAPGGTVIVCFAYYFDDLSSTGSTFRTIVGGSSPTDTTIFRVESDNTGALRCFDNAGQVGSDASSTFSDKTWHWIEVKAVLGTNATNGSLEVRVDGVVKLSETGIDTFVSTPNIMDATYFAGRTGGMRLDDVVIMDGTGSEMNDYIGDSRISTLIPNSNGSETDWSASSGSQYQCVDDVLGGSNDGTDYVYTSASGLLDLQMSNLTDNPAFAHAVQIRTRVTKADVGTRLYRTNVLSGGDSTTGPTKGIGIGYGWVRNGAFYKNPDGNVTWSKSAIDAMQVQLEML